MQIKAAELKPGDKLSSLDSGSIWKVKEVEISELNKPVFNLEVADTHTYFVSNAGLWVHNVCGPDWENIVKFKDKSFTKLGANDQ